MHRTLSTWGAAAAVLLGPAVSGAVDLAEIKARGTLRVIAVTDEQPEMFSFKPGPNPGFEREMTEGFAKLHGLKLEAVAVKTYDDRIPTLAKGEGDVIIGMIETEERRKKVDFTVEVLPARHLAVTHKPHRPVNTIQEFLAERVGVMKGTTWASAATAAGVPASKLESFTDLDQLFEALRAGKVTATVMSISDFTLALKRNPGLQAGVFLGPSGRAAWGIRKEDDQLERALNEYLDNLRKGPSWSRLVVKYFGEEALNVLGRARTQ